MPTYQQLLFGCANPRVGLADRNPMNEVEMIWDWIEHVADTTGIMLDWPADTVLIAPLESEQIDQDEILGVVVGMTQAEARPLDRHVAQLGDPLPKEVGPTTLAELCMPVSADIQTAVLKWEIVRFSARGIDLDLPAGRLVLVEGWFDTKDEATAVR
jgi:hypothetical protein